LAIPFANTTSIGGTSPRAIASPNQLLTVAIPDVADPDPCSQYKTGKRAEASASYAGGV
jgi:hypothetical protein